MRIIEATNERLALGRRGEHLAVRVRFQQAAAWQKTYGSGTFQLLIVVAVSCQIRTDQRK